MYIHVYIYIYMYIYIYIYIYMYIYYIYVSITPIALHNLQIFTQISSLFLVLTSCGGTSNDTVRRSAFTNVSMQGMMKNRPRKRETGSVIYIW